MYSVCFPPELPWRTAPTDPHCFVVTSGLVGPYVVLGWLRCNVRFWPNGGDCVLLPAGTSRGMLGGHHGTERGFGAPCKKKKSLVAFTLTLIPNPAKKWASLRRDSVRNGEERELFGLFSTELPWRTFQAFFFLTRNSVRCQTQ